MSSYYVGLMSGTSLDGVDVALVKFENENQLTVVASETYVFPTSLTRLMRGITEGSKPCDLVTLGTLDAQFGEIFADAVNKLLCTTDIQPRQVTAVGSHGITIIHHPTGDHPFTLQIGDANKIAAHTGITTVADFRRRDIALGGQGAPLAPAFHSQFFYARDEKRVVVNIGGISNVTLLDPLNEVIGFDTGPGNALLDAWHLQHRGKPFDDNGNWASEGMVNDNLMQRLLADDYFSKRPPKSTGKEKFNLGWVTAHLLSMSPPPDPIDVQATLSEITARTIADSILRLNTTTHTCIVCGGGAHNQDLLRRLRKHLPEISVVSSQQLGISPNDVEAVAFAWLAKRTIENKSGNLPKVTGASKASILGAIYPAPITFT